MSVAKIQMYLDDELVLNAETMDVPKKEIAPLFVAISRILAEGIDEDTDLTPLD